MRLLRHVKLILEQGRSSKTYEIDLCEISSQQFVVNFRHGRLGHSLRESTRTASPVPLKRAEKAFNKLLNTQIQKGYEVTEHDTAPDSGLPPLFSTNSDAEPAHSPEPTVQPTPEEPTPAEPITPSIPQSIAVEPTPKEPTPTEPTSTEPTLAEPTPEEPALEEPPPEEPIAQPTPKPDPIPTQPKTRTQTFPPALSLSLPTLTLPKEPTKTEPAQQPPPTPPQENPASQATSPQHALTLWLDWYAQQPPNAPDHPKRSLSSLLWHAADSPTPQNLQPSIQSLLHTHPHTFPLLFAFGRLRTPDSDLSPLRQSTLHPTPTHTLALHILLRSNDPTTHQNIQPFLRDLTDHNDALDPKELAFALLQNPSPTHTTILYALHPQETLETLQYILRSNLLSPTLQSPLLTLLHHAHLELDLPLLALTFHTLDTRAKDLTQHHRQRIHNRRTLSIILRNLTRRQPQHAASLITSCASLYTEPVAPYSPFQNLTEHSAHNALLSLSLDELTDALNQSPSHTFQNLLYIHLRSRYDLEPEAPLEPSTLIQIPKSLRTTLQLPDPFEHIQSSPPTPHSLDQLLQHTDIDPKDWLLEHKDSFKTWGFFEHHTLITHPHAFAYLITSTHKPLRRAALVATHAFALNEELAAPLLRAIIQRVTTHNKPNKSAQNDLFSLLSTQLLHAFHSLQPHELIPLALSSKASDLIQDTTATSLTTHPNLSSLAITDALPLLQSKNPLLHNIAYQIVDAASTDDIVEHQHAILQSAQHHPNPQLRAALEKIFSSNATNRKAFGALLLDQLL